MAIMLEEIEFLKLPDVFGRMPIDYPSTTDPTTGPFYKPNLYEVICLTNINIIEFYWASTLVGTVPQNICTWPYQALPYLPTANTPDGAKYFYYATGKCYARMRNIFDDNIIYCYPIQRFGMPT
jgi:hypothetical protein